MVDDFGLFALGVVADVCVFFSFDVVVDFFLHMLFTQGFCFYLVTHTHRPIPTRPLCEGFALTRIHSH